MKIADIIIEYEKSREKFEADFIKKYSSYSLEPPEILYHYTTASGMKGIIESGCFWATHFRFLNDPKEILYSIDLIDKELKNFITEIKDDIDPDLFEILNEYSNVRERWLKNYDGFNHDVYITSFSEEKDSMSQWEEYGDNGKGYVIGINPNELHYLSNSEEIHNVKKNEYDKFWLVKVEYDKSKQKDIIRKFLKDFIDMLPDPKSFNNRCENNEKIKDDLYRVAVSDYLIFLINFLTFLFKIPKSEGEKEWRFFQPRNPKSINYMIKYRNAGNKKIPYVDFKFCMGIKNILMPLKEIVRGYKSDKIKSETIIKKILLKNSYSRENNTFPIISKSEIQKLYLI